MKGKIKNNPAIISFLLFFIILIIISSFPAKIYGDVSQESLLEKLIPAYSGFRKPMVNYEEPPEFSFNELYTFGSLKGTLHTAIDYVPTNANTNLQVYAVADGIV